MAYFLVQGLLKKIGFDRNVTAAYRSYRLAANQGVVRRPPHHFYLLPGPSFLGNPLGYLPATTTHHHTPTHVQCHCLPPLDTA